MKTIKKTIKPIPQDYEVTRYVADDGTEFETERECRQYEGAQKFQKDMEKVNRLRIYNYDDHIPLHADACYSDCSVYRWYKVNNEEELAEVEEAYGEPTKIKQFPTIVCMEREDEDYIGQPYSIDLETIKKNTIDFFEGLGIKVEFNPI